MITPDSDHYYGTAIDERLYGWVFDLRYMALDNDWPSRTFYRAHPRFFHDPPYISVVIREAIESYRPRK